MMSNPIVVATLTVSIFGCVFLIILAARMLEFWRGSGLGRFRDKGEGVCDLLNYGSLIDDGIVVNKNGSLMVSWLYVAEDSDNSTDDDKEYVAGRLNQAFAKLGNGWMVHFDSIRMESPKYTPSNLCRFPDRATRAIDEEHRRFFERKGVMYEGFHVITLTYFPPLLAQAKFVELMFDDEGAEVTPRTRSARILQDFKHAISNFESDLTSVFKVARLRATEYTYEDGTKHKHDEQLQFLQLCLTGIVQPVVLPKNPSCLDGLLGGQEMWGGTIPKIGDKYIQIVAIEGFPLESYVGILRSLTDVAVSCRFSNRFIFQDRHQALKAATDHKKKWKQKERGLIDTLLNRPVARDNLNQDAMAMVMDAQEAIREIEEGQVAFGYYTACVVLMDEDRHVLDTASRELSKAISNLGFAVRVETVNTLDAFLGTLPGHGEQNVRRPNINTLNFAHFVPTASIYTGVNAAPCPFYPPLSPPLLHCVTSGNTPYRMNLHVGDVGHTFIVGQTGGGKSTLLARLGAASMVYEDNTIFALDKGMSMYTLCLAAGGRHFEVGADDSDLCFAPFQFLHTPGDRAWCLDWVDKILRLNDVATLPEERNEIAQALDLLGRGLKGGHNPSIVDFLAQVQSKRIREAMQQYTPEGLMGGLLSASEDGLAMSRFNVFEIEKLMELGEKWALPVLEYLFRRIYMALKGQPAWLLLDEAWLMFQHPVFSAQIRQWLKVLRKANCAVVMATQNLNDFMQSSIYGDILESTASKIFLPNRHARSEDVAPMYTKMGLNKQQISIISSAIAKRQYYHVSDNGKRLVELGLGPIALSLCAVSDKESITAIKKLHAMHGDGWLDIWVKERTGLDINDYQGPLAA
jgi:type IV secretion system protein VirB4